jgi:translation machinery-associated protein 16
LEGVLSDETSNVVTQTMMLELANGYLTRFQQEVDQIKLKNSIGEDKKNKKIKTKDHNRSRMDVIKFTIETETNEFEGCGLEMPNLLDEENFKYFNNWNGELRFLQNIGLKRFRKDTLSHDTNCHQNMEAD